MNRPEFESVCESLKANRPVKDEIQDVIRFLYNSAWRPKSGVVQSRYYSLNSACADVGLGGTVPYDMRRSGIRNFTRAGLGESEGMSTSGHRTNSTYKRYNIIDEDLQRSSLQRLYAGERASQSGPAQTGWTEVIGQTSDKRAIFEGRGKVIFLGQAHG